MQRPPRAADAPLLDRESLRFILSSGGLKAGVALALLGLLPLAGASLDLTRGAVFLFLAVGQLLFAYPARRTEVTPGPNRLLHLAIAIGILAQVPILLLPVLLVVAAAALLTWGAAEGAGRLVWGRRNS